MRWFRSRELNRERIESAIETCHIATRQRQHEAHPPLWDDRALEARPGPPSLETSPGQGARAAGHGSSHRDAKPVDMAPVLVEMKTRPGG